MTTALKDKRTDWLLGFSRVFVGVLFILSGLIKANDPLGFAYKLEEYFEVFHTTFLSGISVHLSILFCALEVILGAALLLGYQKKLVSWGLLLLIVFFSFLTFWSAAFDVVRTCGCFGDAIVLTPWQSFAKDLVLLIFILVIVKRNKKIHPLFAKKWTSLAMVAVVLFSFGFGIVAYNFLPFVDFLPYKVGDNVVENMKIPEGAPQDVFEIIYSLKNNKTGETKKMTDAEYLKTEIWKDTNWVIVGQPENRLLKKGFEPKIKDLHITDETGTDYTQELLGNPYYNLVVVAYNLKEADVKALGDINAIAVNAAEHYNIRTVLLTSASPESAKQFMRSHHLAFELFYADGVPLKSMVRANPGILLMQNGIVVNKWHYNSLPAYLDLESTYFRNNGQ